MAVVKRFFFWFSVRLGTIIVSTFSLIQAAIWLMISIISIENQEDVRAFLQEIITSLNVKNKHFVSFAENPYALLVAFTVFCALFLLSCILLICGALMCKCKLLYPFLVLDMMYINVMIILMTLLLINFKKRGYGIGSLILYSNLTAVIGVILIYMWVTVLSLVQIIRELRSEIIDNHILLKDRPRQMKQMIDKRYQETLNN